MPHPENILRALPLSGAFPEYLTNALPDGAAPVNLSAAFDGTFVANALETSPGSRPVNTLDALPVSRSQTGYLYTMGANSIAWGHPGQASFVLGNETSGFYNRYTRGLGFGGSLSGSVSMAALIDPGIDTGFSFVLTMRSDMNDVNSRMNVVVRQGGVFFGDYFYGNPGYVGALPATDGGLVTGSFVEYVIPFNPADVALINWAADITFNCEYGGVVFVGGTSTWDVTQAKLLLPSP
jgi:hypothetical protein